MNPLMCSWTIGPLVSLNLWTQTHSEVIQIHMPLNLLDSWTPPYSEVEAESTSTPRHRIAIHLFIQQHLTTYVQGSELGLLEDHERNPTEIPPSESTTLFHCWHDTLNTET